MTSVHLSEGLIMRPPTMDDLKIVHELYLAHDLNLYGEEDMTLEDLRLYWTAPTHDLGRDQRLIFDQAGQLLACLYMEQRSHAKFFVDVIVRPGYSDPRPGDALFELGEIWAREQMVQAEPGVRVTLNTSASANNRDLLERCARMGLQENRRYWRMAIDLHEAPTEPTWPEGVTLRPFVPERDARAVFEMIETAFSDHWGHLPRSFDEWRQRKIERADFDAALWLIAYHGDQIVGGSLCSTGTQNWVETLGTLRAWRRKGLGLALLYHSFGEFYRRGKRQVVLGVDSQNLTGATRLYKRAGMYVKRENISFEKELRAGVELSTQVLTV
ncbi:MAG: GNAT family N-acetyltransferase [Ktedonobacteraceae bacterium]